MLIWTDDLVDKVKSLYLAGHSDSQISAKLADEDQFFVTRNAIIGKRHREGIARSEADPRPKFASTAPRRTRLAAHLGGAIAQKITRAIRAKKVHAEAPSIEPMDLHLIDGFRHLTLMELAEDTCRFPYGDGPNFSFCGLSPYEGLPYCAHHSRLSYVAPEVR